MKAIFALILIYTTIVPEIMAQQTSRDSLTVTILLRTRTGSADSVLVILDRHDLTGPSVINQIFYPVQNKIVIQKVPKGKYYIDIRCMGISEQTFTIVQTIGERRSNRISVPLESFETYDPGKVTIPPSFIDFTNLVITRKTMK